MKVLFSYFMIFSLLCPPAFAQSLNDAFSVPGGLTDEEKKASNEFVHQGIKDESIKDGCEKNGLGTCSEADVNAQAAVIKGQYGQMLEENIGRLYAVIFGAGGLMSGKGPTVKVVDKKYAGPTKDADGKDIKKKDKAEEKADYCIYAAMGYELIAGFTQTAMQDKIQKKLNEENDLQLRSLVSLKLTHEARAKTASYQRAIYGATAACYIARAAASKGRVVMDWKYWAKMSAATGLTALYWAKVKKHKNAALNVQAVIDGLPKSGSCNPWTNTACFCAEPTSKTAYPDNYEDVCVVHSSTTTKNSTPMACGVLVNGQMTVDADCKCKASNTCFKTKIAASSVKFGIGGNFMGVANKGYDLLGDGNFDAGKLDSYGLEASVYAAKIRDKVATTPIPKISLTAEQKKVADGLSQGMPAAAAAIVASSNSMTPPNGNVDSGIKAALDKVPANLKAKIEASENVQYNSGGPGFESLSNGGEEKFAIPGTAGAETQGQTEVLTFAEKAISNADITNTPDTPIFDIISNRYMHSTGKLKVEEQK